mmetsp:Transcript_41509/g.125776  ORF Transcript_41509/g.125776 Transcript_41509/m.125776 type:complete len:204 (+) Transcript_41509:2398-3009(+)
MDSDRGDEGGAPPALHFQGDGFPHRQGFPRGVDQNEPSPASPGSFVLRVGVRVRVVALAAGRRRSRLVGRFRVRVRVVPHHLDAQHLLLFAPAAVHPGADQRDQQGVLLLPLLLPPHRHLDPAQVQGVDDAPPPPHLAPGEDARRGQGLDAPVQCDVGGPSPPLHPVDRHGHRQGHVADDAVQLLLVHLLVDLKAGAARRPSG